MATKRLPYDSSKMIGDRIINDHSFMCDCLQGLVVEHFLGYYEGNTPNGMDMLMLKLREKALWQRFFLDAGIGFWEELDEVSAFFDYDDMQPIDLAKEYSLIDKVVENIICNGSEKEFSSIIFEIGSSELRLKFLNPADIDSATILERL